MITSICGGFSTKTTENILLENTGLYIYLSFTAPLNITQSLSDLNVLLGQNGTLSITCDAFPAPKVTWYVTSLHSQYHKLEIIFPLSPIGSSTTQKSRILVNTKSSPNKTSFLLLSINVIILMLVHIVCKLIMVSITLIKQRNSMLEVSSCFRSL
jgi:hypothetical protein